MVAHCVWDAGVGGSSPPAPTCILLQRLRPQGFFFTGRHVWYNFNMPTPFYHLYLAEDVLTHPALRRDVSFFLRNYLGAFRFGNTAPDVQVVSQQSRDDTHFYTFYRPNEAELPWDKILVMHPVLANSINLTASQASFIAGYLCHLQADWLWLTDIFFPFFSKQSSLGEAHQRSYLHNVVRCHLDRKIVKDLPEGMADSLKQVRPLSWLPFVDDKHLCQWRDLLYPQLEPGAAIQTVEVFATRQGIAPADFYSLLDSDILMEQKVFSHLPQRCLEAYRHKALSMGVSLLNRYLVAQSRDTARMMATGVGVP